MSEFLLIIIFWLFIALMTVLALGLVLYPLTCGRVVKQKIYWLTLIFAIVLPCFSIFTYLHLGAEQALEKTWSIKKAEQEARTLLKTIKTPDQIIALIRRHLEKVPNSAEGWHLLGKLYLEEHQYARSEQSFWKAYTLQPNNINYAVSYAQAAFFRNHHHLTDRAKALLQKIIAKDPENIMAINLLAVNAYMQKNYLQAINLWEKLILLFPEGSRDQQAVLLMINRAQKEIVDKPKKYSNSRRMSLHAKTSRFETRLSEKMSQ